MLNDRYCRGQSWARPCVADSGIDEIPIMCERGYVANANDTVRNINTVPTNRRLRVEVFFPADQISRKQPVQSPVPRIQDVFRMWPRPKSRFHACISSILHINLTKNPTKIYKQKM